MIQKIAIMNFIELATYRSSVRNFEPKPIEKEKLLYVLEAARIAPSAVNFQPWQFIVVTDPDILISVQKVYPREWLLTAPVIIIALGDHKKGWHRNCDGKDFTDIDLAIAIDHLMLAAAEQGLGTCWVCNFDINKCCDLFEIPENLEPIAFIPIGYPVEKSGHEKNREPLEGLVHWNKFY